MAIMDNSAEQDVARLWELLQQLAEQTQHHRTFTANLHVQASGLKSQAIHSQTGFVLRRFNLDKTQEEYDAELERMNALMSAENQALQHDNKQLNTLIKDYETTLESVMNQFRNRAHEVQEQELSLIRDYESRLIARETQDQAAQLNATVAYSESLSHISNLLRRTLRLLNGEPDPSSTPTSTQPLASPTPSSPASSSSSSSEEVPVWQTLTFGNVGAGDTEADEENPSDADHALEHEIELARLEKENEILRRLAGIPFDLSGDPLPKLELGLTHGGGMGSIGGGGGGMGMGGGVSEDGRMSVIPVGNMTRERGALLGGPKGTVGPFGTYKRMRAGHGG